MFCEGAAVSGRASRLKAYTAVFSAGLVMGMAVGIAGALVWGALGEAEWWWHLSSYRNLREDLIRRAERQGRYPRDLAAVIEERGYAKHVNAEALGYSAAGEVYDIHEGDLIVFYERRPHRYGFLVGRFEMRQGYHNFRLGPWTSDGAAIP